MWSNGYDVRLWSVRREFDSPLSPSYGIANSIREFRNNFTELYFDSERLRGRRIIPVASCVNGRPWSPTKNKGVLK